MTLRAKKVARKNTEKTYYSIVDEKRVNGKVVQKYVGYMGKVPGSKNDIKPEDIMKYIQRLMNKGISQEDIDQILRKIGIEYDTGPIIKIIRENKLRIKNITLTRTKQ